MEYISRIKSTLLVETTDDRKTTDRMAHDCLCERTARASVMHRSYGEIMEPCTTDIGTAVGKVGDHHSVQICFSPPISVINSACCCYEVLLIITSNNLVCGYQFSGGYSSAAVV